MRRRSQGLYFLVLVAVLAVFAIIYFTSGSPEPVQRPVLPPPLPPPQDKILVAARYIQEGKELTLDDMDWQTWPREIIPDQAIVNKIEPRAQSELTGSIARSSFSKGEYIQYSKLVKKGGGGWVASILPNGHRLVSFNVTPNTASGGFLQPKDKVDVVMAPKGATDMTGVAILMPQVHVFAINGQTDPIALSLQNQGQLNIPPTSITLLVTIEQANILLEIANHRQLYFNLRPLNETPSDTEEFDLSDIRISPITIQKFDQVTRVVN